MKKTSTLRTLILSVLALLVCASMLIGTTFAWFTDSVTSRNNIIKSGNLDIVLEYYDEESKSFKPVDKTVAIFDDTALWEPGYTEVAYLRISNAGSLALKYNLDVNVYGEKAGKNVYGNSFNLSDYLVFKVIDIDETAVGTYTRDTAIAAAGNVMGLKTYNGITTSLQSGDDKYVALIIYMPTTVDNVANHMTGAENIPSISMGVNLSATQYTYEVDSYGPDYDGSAEIVVKPTTSWYYDADGSVEDPYVLYTAEDLAGFAAIVNGTATSDVMTLADTSAPSLLKDDFNGKLVTLGADIDLGNCTWTPIGIELNIPFRGVFDGNGHTVSNFTVDAAAGSALFGFVRNGSAKAAIKNVNVENVVATGNDYVAGIVGQLYATMENCHAENVKVVATPYLQADGTYDGGAKAGGVVGWIESGNIYSVTNCSATNVDIRAYRDLGSVIGMAHNNNIITNCKAYDSVLQYVGIPSGTAYEDGKVNENIGEVIGRRGSNVTETGSYYENVVIIASAYDAASLKAAIASGAPVALMCDIAVDSTIEITANTTISGNGFVVEREDGYTGTIFSVASGATLTLDDIVLDGGAVWTADLSSESTRTNTGKKATGNLIATTGNGSIVLGKDAVLQNNDGAHAVSLATRGGGTLTINGGQIINNSSDSGAIWGGGHITMNDGKISHNSSTGLAGAIRMVSSCNFAMNGGEINYNTAASDGGVIWGYGSSTYNFNGGEMAYNEAGGVGGTIYLGTYSVVNIGGDFELHDNKAANSGAIRFTDHSSLNMTGGKIYNNSQDSGCEINTWNNSMSLTGGEISDDMSYVGGLGLTIGKADITGVIAYDLSTNHNTAYLAKEFNGFKFTVNEGDEHFGNFNFKPADGYIYAAGDEDKLVCMNEGYVTYWDATTSTFRLKAE